MHAKSVIVLVATILLSGCSLVNKYHPNLATRLVKQYPEMQSICDRAGGCWNVTVTCEKYDNTGNSSLRNSTWWTIETDDGSYGMSKQDNDNIDTPSAIRDAISEYGKKLIWPNVSRCEKDCGQ